MEFLLGESASLSATAASACFVTLCSVDEADGDVALSGILGGCTGRACIQGGVALRTSWATFNEILPNVLVSNVTPHDPSTRITQLSSFLELGCPIILKEMNLLP